MSEHTRARMREGVRPIGLGGTVLVPPYPAYWAIPKEYVDAVDLHVKAGDCEYDIVRERAADGNFQVSSKNRNPKGR